MSAKHATRKHEGGPWKAEPVNTIAARSQQIDPRIFGSHMNLSSRLRPALVP